MLTATLLSIATAALSPQEVQRSPLHPDLLIRFTESELKALGARYPLGKSFHFIEGKDGGAAVQFDEPTGPPNRKTFSVIQIPHRSEMHFSTGATIDFWARVDQEAGFDGLGQFTHGPNWSAVLLAKSGDRIGFALNYNPRAFQSRYGGIFLGTYDWTFNGMGCEVTAQPPILQTATWFRTTITLHQSAGYQIFLNKVLTIDCTNARPDFRHTNTQDLFIGANGAKYGPFTGSLQDIAIYRRALSREEVSSLPDSLAQPVKDYLSNKTNPAQK